MTRPNNSVESILSTTKRFIPKSVFASAAPMYHFKLQLLAAMRYRFPSKELTVIAVTGTKGKSTTVEMMNAILEAAGNKTAVSNTIRFKIGEKTEPNMYKMSMPGRGAIHKFLREAVDAECTHAVLEITSQAVLTSRHRFLDLDALIYTNISPEHIEAHGSFEKYKEAKLKIARLLGGSSKKQKYIVVNGDDEHAEEFVKAAKPAHPIRSLLQDAVPYESNENGTRFMFNGEEIVTKLPGEFNIQNMLCAAHLATEMGISVDAIKKGLEGLTSIRGRVENVNEGGKFGVYVDYAHTADSLEKLYQAFEGKKIIAVLGNTGGGRDTWKRPVMAKVAEKYAHTIIFTNEDPYDEDPQSIIDEMKAGMTDTSNVIVELDRRTAIRLALAQAGEGDVVLITGKGTDPYIMGANNSKELWDDATVAREEIEKLT